MNFIQPWMQDTITVASLEGVNQFGEPILGEQRTIKVRIEEKFQEIVDTEGQTVVSNSEIASLDEIKIDDRIWLPNTDTGIVSDARTPLNIQQARDRFGRIKLFMIFMRAGR